MNIKRILIECKGTGCENICFETKRERKRNHDKYVTKEKCERKRIIAAKTLHPVTHKRLNSTTFPYE
jgi:hypothetical protein